MYKDYYVRRNGQWISLNTGKPFSGIVRSGNTDIGTGIKNA